MSRPRAYLCESRSRDARGRERVYLQVRARPSGKFLRSLGRVPVSLEKRLQAMKDFDILLPQGVEGLMVPLPEDPHE